MARIHRNGGRTLHYPTREAPIVGLPGSRTAAPVAARWYVETEDASLSLRLVPGAVLCEGFDGELVASVDEAEHAARFDIVDGELWVTCVAGQIFVDREPIARIAHLHAGNHLRVGTTLYVISNTLTELTGPVPMLVREAFPAAATPARVDKANKPAAGMRLFYEEPLEVEEITITEPAARPHLVAARDRRTSSFPTSTVPDAQVPPQGAVAQAANPLPMAATQFFRTPTLRVARSKAKSRLPATALMVLGLLAAGAFAAYNFLDHGVVERWVEQTRDRLLSAVSPQPQSPTLAAEPRQPFEMIMAQAPAAVAADEPVDGLASDPRFDELTTYAWLRDINQENHERFLTLAESLLASENTPPLLEHVRYYASRLAVLEQRDVLAGYTRAFGDVFIVDPQYRDVIAMLEGRLLTLNTHANQLARMNADAARYFEQDALTLPPKANVVAVARNMLSLDSQNKDALTWITRTADILVERASDKASTGDTFAARNLVEDVLAFAPAHPRANAMWLALSNQHAGT